MNEIEAAQAKIFHAERMQKMIRMDYHYNRERYNDNMIEQAEEQVIALGRQIQKNAAVCLGLTW